MGWGYVNFSKNRSYDQISENNCNFTTYTINLGPKYENVPWLRTLCILTITVVID